MTESSGCTSLVHSVSCKPLSSFSTRGLAVLVAAYTLRLQQKMKTWVQKSENAQQVLIFLQVLTLKKRQVSVWWDVFSVATLPLAYACRGVGNFFRFCTEHRAPSEWVAAVSLIFSSLSLLLPATLVWCLSGGLDD